MFRSAISLTLALTALAMGRPASDSSNGNWVSTMGTKCTGNDFTLSDFEGAAPNKSAQGGRWFSFTDQNATGKASGASTIIEQEGAIDGIVYLSGDAFPTALAGITAKLDKGDASLHPQGGWAGIATSFKDADDSETYLDIKGLKAISFYLALEEPFDTASLTGVTLKVGHSPSLVADSAPFQASVDISKFNNQEICIDIEQFKQPAWFKGPLSSMPLTQIGKLKWEIRINNDTTKSASATSFFIGNVRMHGWAPCCFEPTPDPGTSIQETSVAAPFTARYTDGLVLSYDLPGVSSAKIQVLRLDGSKVASFDGAAKASNQSFSANLARGTYLAVVQGGSHKLVAPFAVTK